MPDTLRFGTPGAANATTLLLLGSGELGKELLVEAQALGVETVAVDRYESAPAMQVAHRSHTIDMTDAEALGQLVAEEEPDYIVPEIEDDGPPAHPGVRCRGSERTDQRVRFRRQ